MTSLPIHIGCAGWTIPKAFAGRFPAEGNHLERYARVFSAVEINSSFYRSHKPATYERWANSVPEGFRFSVKVPRLITHTHRLKDADATLTNFLAECSQLGAKLGLLLVQLPPSLGFDKETASTIDRYFLTLRRHFNGDVACEPRHPTWFGPEPNRLLSSYHVARVAADPSIVARLNVEEAEMTTMPEPGGWSGLVYYRLHGSPRIYYSAYPDSYLQALARTLAEAGRRGARVWCIFDNTAEGSATGDALAVMDMLATDIRYPGLR
jgi:uncharacterized protein YecE (DUF72 family)